MKRNGGLIAAAHSVRRKLNPTGYDLPVDAQPIPDLGSLLSEFMPPPLSALIHNLAVPRHKYVCITNGVNSHLFDVEDEKTWHVDLCSLRAPSSTTIEPHRGNINHEGPVDHESLRFLAEGHEYCRSTLCCVVTRREDVVAMMSSTDANGDTFLDILSRQGTMESVNLGSGERTTSRACSAFFSLQQARRETAWDDEAGNLYIMHENGTLARFATQTRKWSQLARLSPCGAFYRYQGYRWIIVAANSMLYHLVHVDDGAHVNKYEPATNRWTELLTQCPLALSYDSTAAAIQTPP